MTCYQLRNNKLIAISNVQMATDIQTYKRIVCGDNIAYYFYEKTIHEGSNPGQGVCIKRTIFSVNYLNV